MRPVDKGTAPNTYTKYQEAGPDLQERLGDYCSYCERQIETHLAVEHIQPKCLVPALSCVWGNFLLGCANCNSSKGDTAINISDYLWPDCDNTLRALIYARGGVVTPNSALSAPIQAKAQATIELIGIDKDPGHPTLSRRPSDRDRRWFKRQETWILAEKCRDDLAAQDTTVVRELIVSNAIARGMFSIWWTVFSGDVDMRRRLRQVFLGTDPACFDTDENLKVRAGGQV